MNNNQHCFIQAQDDFDRLLSQTQSLLTVLTANDNFMHIDKREVANALWLAMDRLTDIEAAYQRTVQAAS